MKSPIVAAVMFVMLMSAMVWCGYAEGKRTADRWWQAQPERIITKIEYREGAAEKVYVAKDGEEYDAVLRGWYLQGGHPSPCVELNSTSRVLLENIQMGDDIGKPCRLIAPTKGKH